MTRGPALARGTAVAAVLVLGVAACGSAGAPGDQQDDARPSVASSIRSSVPETSSGAEGFTSARSYRAVAAPTRVRIPSARVDSVLGRVGLAADGTIAAPTLWQQAAWYDRGPRPGQDGPAVIVGHVDSTSGPAVFARLGGLRDGERILVDRADGTTATFTVSRRDQFAKAGFPASRVYAPTLRSSLLLISCGGVFDTASGHYRDNIVVTAVPG